MWTPLVANFHAGISDPNNTSKIHLTKTTTMYLLKHHVSIDDEQSGSNAVCWSVPLGIRHRWHKRITCTARCRTVRQRHGPRPEGAVDLLQLFCVFSSGWRVDCSYIRGLDRGQQRVAMGFWHCHHCHSAFDCDFCCRVSALSE